MDTPQSDPLARTPSGLALTACLAAAIASLMALPPAAANIPNGMLCDDCHTMHNSQDGAPVALLYNPGSNQLEASTTPQGSLLRKDCVACHTGTNNGANTIPYVFSIEQPTYGATGISGNTLAGGSFYWVAQGDNASGHNVKNLTTPDPAAPIGLGTTPPGGSLMASQITCAGYYGCHGDRGVGVTNETTAMHRSHHPVQTDPVKTGADIVSSYRFLSGIAGREDSDWEYQPTSGAHNQYKGEDRSWDTS
ncbi:MAG: hypothetical protein AB1634_13790, partial [Thermodesulfobacteriota bacterium]